MSIRNEFDLTREARPEVLVVIEDLLSSPTVSSVHYIGYAHEPILRLLHRHLGTSFSVMDASDRYHTGAAFFWEGDGDYPGPARPDWLVGVPFYQEGLPDSDLLIWDAPSSYSEQLFAILKDRCPMHLLLLDEACSAATHPAYSWVLLPTYAVGTFNQRNASRRCSTVSVNCRFFVCDDCKQYIDAGYRWAYWLLEHPEIVRLGETVDTPAIFAATDYWQPPPEERSAWLVDEILPTVRQFLLAHTAHSLRYVESEHLNDHADYVELPNSRDASRRGVGFVRRITRP